MEYIYNDVQESLGIGGVVLKGEQNEWTNQRIHHNHLFRVCADKIFMFLGLEAIACGLISGVYILVGGANGIHI